jgi:hypothetical protein
VQSVGWDQNGSYGDGLEGCGVVSPGPG